MNEKLLLTKKEAADYLGINEDDFGLLAFDGYIGAVQLKPEGDFRYRRTDIEAFVDGLPTLRAMRRLERASNASSRASNAGKGKAGKAGKFPLYPLQKPAQLGS